jgi:hypothetical protein
MYRPSEYPFIDSTIFNNAYIPEREAPSNAIRRYNSPESQVTRIINSQAISPSKVGGTNSPLL